MMRHLLFVTFGFAVGVLVLGAFLLVRLGDTEEALENHAIMLTQRLDALDIGMRELAVDAATLRSDLAAQQIIVAEETANIRQSIDSSVLELSSTIGEQGTTLKTLSTVADVSGLIDRWSPYVYDITCEFKDTNGDKREGSGSATLMYSGAEIIFMTNAHVVEEDDATLVKCRLEQPGSDDPKISIDASKITVNEDVDLARGVVQGVYPSMTAGSLCAGEPRIGERIITLGYPAIGAKESVTVTEGIISGFDEDYYATSAKIERGNSGGAAVSIERDCFLGTPTLVVAGRIESLARILPAVAL